MAKARRQPIDRLDDYLLENLPVTFPGGAALSPSRLPSKWLQLQVTFTGRLQGNVVVALPQVSRNGTPLIREGEYTCVQGEIRAQGAWGLPAGHCRSAHAILYPARSRLLVQ